MNSKKLMSIVVFSMLGFWINFPQLEAQELEEARGEPTSTGDLFFQNVPTARPPRASIVSTVDVSKPNFRAITIKNISQNTLNLQEAKVVFRYTGSAITSVQSKPQIKWGIRRTSSGKEILTSLLPQSLGLAPNRSFSISFSGNGNISRIKLFASIIAPSPTPSPAPLNFVRRNGTKLVLNQQPFRIVGPNIFWLGLDYHTGSLGYPSRQRIAEAFAISKAMRATTIRAFVGISARKPFGIVSEARQYNDQAFDPIDYAVYQAHKHNIRLIIPFTDQHYYYKGGKLDFLNKRGLFSDSELQKVQNDYRLAANNPKANQFYSQRVVIDDFKDYIKHFLTHKNPYTGLQYKDDPYILAWETGNELGAWNLGRNNPLDPPPPASWTREIAQFTKSIDSNHLIVDGPDGVLDADLSIPELDIYSRHGYAPQISILQQEVAKTNAANKVYIVGEFDAMNKDGGDYLKTYVDFIKNNGIGGDLWWSLFGRNDNCTGNVVHDDGYTITYPGLDQNQRNRLLILTNHAIGITGQSNFLPTLPTVNCRQDVSVPSFDDDANADDANGDDDVDDLESYRGLTASSD